MRGFRELLYPDGHMKFRVAPADTGGTRMMFCAVIVYESHDTYLPVFIMWCGIATVHGTEHRKIPKMSLP